jgi:hypothetical protein
MLRLNDNAIRMVMYDFSDSAGFQPGLAKLRQ